jgi:hypothetical protein
MRGNKTKKMRTAHCGTGSECSFSDSSAGYFGRSWRTSSSCISFVHAAACSCRWLPEPATALQSYTAVSARSADNTFPTARRHRYRVPAVPVPALVLSAVSVASVCVLSYQYLYFCTSKASKPSTSQDLSAVSAPAPAAAAAAAAATLEALRPEAVLSSSRSAAWTSAGRRWERTASWRWTSSAGGRGWV